MGNCLLLVCENEEQTNLHKEQLKHGQDQNHFGDGAKTIKLLKFGWLCVAYSRVWVGVND